MQCTGEADGNGLAFIKLTSDYLVNKCLTGKVDFLWIFVNSQGWG